MPKQPLPDHALEVLDARWDGTAIVLQAFCNELRPFGWSRTDILNLVRERGLKNRDESYLALHAQTLPSEPDQVVVDEYDGMAERLGRMNAQAALMREGQVDYVEKVEEVAVTIPAEPANAPGAIVAPMRRCTKCAQAYPATLQYFAKHHRAAGHVGKLCIACHSESFRRGALAHMAEAGIPRSERTLRREQADPERAVTIIQAPAVQQLRSVDPTRFGVLESTMKTLPVDRGTWTKADKQAFMKLFDSVLDFVFALDEQSA